MTLTDFTILILSLFLLSRGSERGFMRSLMDPVSLIIATIVCILYYQATRDLIVTLLIGLLGPILLNYIFKAILQTYATATNTNIRPGFLSSLAGAILTLAWGWVFIIITLILLTLFPAQKEPLITLHHDVITSISYNTAMPWVGHVLPILKEPSTSATNVNSTSDAQSLAQDPRFQKILQDDEIRQEINSHDMGKLMSNPKIMALTQQIMSDPEMIKKVLSAWRSQSKNASP